MSDSKQPKNPEDELQAENQQWINSLTIDNYMAEVKEKKNKIEKNEKLKRAVARRRNQLLMKKNIERNVEVQGLLREQEQVRANFVMPLVFPKKLRGQPALLMYGPPGTGKTLIAKGLVGEFDSLTENVVINFEARGGAELLDRYVGNTEKNIKQLYLKAQANAIGPRDRTLVFIDEAEALMGNRSEDSSGLLRGAVNTFLTMLDGATSFDRVITVAATNEPWVLDPAILRRLKTKLFIDLPGRGAIVKMIMLTCVKLRSQEGGKQKFIQDLKPHAKKLADYFVFRKEYMKKLQSLVGNNNRFTQFMNDGDHKISECAHWPYGLTGSDVTTYLTEAWNEIGLEKLKRATGTDGCRFYIDKKEEREKEGKKQQKPPLCDESERQKVDKWDDKELLDENNWESIKRYRFRFTATPLETTYPEYVYYYLNNRRLSDSQRRSLI